MSTATTYGNNMMSHLWDYLQGLPMTSGEQQWLADRLMEASQRRQTVQDKLVFPSLPKDFKPSDEVMALSCGPLPEGFDVDKELENMWEEWAR